MISAFTSAWAAPAKADSVEIAWPSGVKESFTNLPANHLFILQETKGILETRKFRSKS